MDVQTENIEFLRTWAQINTQNLISNLRVVKSALPDTTLPLAVVKADAYGHGAVNAAKSLENEVSYFMVAEPNEAIQLRKSGITKPILIAGMVLNPYLEVLSDLDITICIYSFDYAQKINDTLLKLNKKIKIHLKLDTGMHRLGIMPERLGALEEAIKILSLSQLEAEGVFSHFAESDDLSSDYTKTQLDKFKSFVNELENKGFTFKYRHISNSAAALLGDNSCFNLARIGIMLYGSYPSEEVKKKWLKLHPDKKLLPVMTLKSRVAQIKILNTGESIGYGRNFYVKRPTKIAVITAGYADGIPRLISSKAYAIEKGLKVSGRVCMDMFFVDITDSSFDIREGDIVNLFGEDSVPVENWAKAAKTISYEIFCRISKRVPRIYTY